MRASDPRASSSRPAPLLLSRRQLLKAAGGLGALVVLGALPGEAEAASLSALTAAQLTAAMKTLPKSGTVRLPGGKTAKAPDLRAAGTAFGVGDPANPDPASNPVTALGVLCAVAAWSGRSGTLDLSATLPSAPLRPLRLALPYLPGGAAAETIASAIPPALVVRPKGSLVLVGTLSGHRVVAALEDPVRQVAGHPRLELVLLRSADLAALLATLRARLDSSGTAVVLASGSKVPLRPIQSALVSRLVRAAGVRFVDRAPLQPPDATGPLLTVEPVVPAPPSAVVPSYARVSQAPDGRVLALDAGGTAVGRARYRRWRPDWTWTRSRDEIEGYTVRELADALGLPVGSFINSNGFAEPAFIGGFEKIVNRLHLVDELASQTVYGAFTVADWTRVLDRWPAVSAALAAGSVPTGYPYVWHWADEALAFGRARGVHSIRGPGFIGGTVLPFPAIYSADWTRDELTRLLEFMVKTLLLKYSSRVTEWSGVSEASSDMLFGNAQKNFWYERLGTDVIDQVFVWAHETAPQAVLCFAEDHILEPETDARRQVIAKYFAFLDHFKTTAVPVDAALIENNLWIYTAPARDQMVATLKEILALGYRIAAPEALVSVSERDPLWPDHQPTVSVTDPLTAQTDLYAALLGAYLEVDAPFGLGGFTDRYSWLAETGNPDARAMLLNADYSPKPAYFAVRDLLKQRAGLA